MMRYHRTSGGTLSRYDCAVEPDVPCQGEHVVVVNEAAVATMVAAYDDLMANHDGRPNAEVGDPADDLVEYMRTVLS